MIKFSKYKIKFSKLKINPRVNIQRFISQSSFHVLLHVLSGSTDLTRIDFCGKSK